MTAYKLVVFAAGIWMIGCTTLAIESPKEVQDHSAPTLVERWRGCRMGVMDERFEVVFGRGQACGALLGEAAWALDPSGLSPEWQRTWYDGIGHGMARPPRDLSAWQARVRGLPPKVHDLAHQSAIRAWTLSVAGAPERVLPWLEDYEASVPREEQQNGVRMGLQAALGGDLDAAIAVAMRYPAPWHPALFEELGWRAGDRRTGLVEATLRHLEPLGPTERCAFAQGAARAFTMRLIQDRQGQGAAGWAELTELIDRLDPQCRSAAWGGVGWAAILGVGRDPERVAQALAPVTSERGRRRAAEVAAWASQSHHVPWSLPEMSPPGGSSAANASPRLPTPPHPPPPRR